MRTYLILKDKAQRFAADRDIQALLAEIRHEEKSDAGLLKPYSRAAADALLGHQFDRVQLASRARNYERLDQLVIDLLLGTR
jgi:xylose isomerase